MNRPPLFLPRSSAALKGSMLVYLASTLYATAAPLTIEGITTTGPLGASGSASTGVQNMIDGSFQATSFQQFLGPSSVTLDLGSIQAVDRLVVIGRFATGVLNLTEGNVEVSANGVDWFNVATVQNQENLGGGTTLALGFAEQNARYVRLNLTSTTVNEQIGELQVYHGSGPRLSLIDRGSAIQTTGTDRVPFNIVDGNDSTFALFHGAAGNFTVRLDGVEYQNGWNGITLSGRSFTNSPSNPGQLTILAGDSLDSLTSILTQSNAVETTNYEYSIDFDTTYHYKYIQVMWQANPDWAVTQSNVQILEFGVRPIPEPSSLAILAMGAAALGVMRLRRKGQV